MFNYHTTELRTVSKRASSAPKGVANTVDHQLVIVPTDRHQREKVEAGWPENQVVTFPNLLHSVNRTKPLDLIPEAHQRMVLAHVVHELAYSRKLKAFGKLAEQPGFLNALFTELSELSGLNVDPADFAEGIRQLSTRPRQKDADVALIYESYRATLAQHRWRDRAVEYADAINNLSKSFREVFPNCNVVAVEGIVEFAPPQIAMLQLLRQLGVELRVGLPLAEESEREDLWRVAEYTAASLANIASERQHVAGTEHSKVPAGINYVLRELFRSEVTPSSNAAGLHLIEAPGPVGEVKLVMRRIKSLLLDGVAAGEILVTMRDMSAYADLMHEFAGEYGIPIDLESTTPLSRVPVVAAILKAASLPETDWPFTGTGALLRSSYLKPNWPEVEPDPEIALDTELLLRWLGEPRGRGAYLQTATIKARSLDPALEDEAAGESHRQYVQKLAEQCLPFLTRFFSAWDKMPTEATLHDHIAWLKSFADDLGFTRSANDRDAIGLHRFFAELQTWADRDGQLHPRALMISTTEFIRRAAWIANSNNLPRSPAEPNRVRIVPAELAAGLTYHHLFLMGLSEGSFPKLGAGSRIYDEHERREFHGVGIELDVGENRRSAEMLLFFRLLAAASQSITISYPAVDEKGQALLPAIFLKDVTDLFSADAIPTTRRAMLIEGLDADLPMSPAEYRWRFALSGGEPGPLSSDLIANLQAAQIMAQRRFQSAEHGQYDGLLANAQSRSKIETQFNPSVAYSATALESYVACPFKYFVGSVLKLQALPEPGAEIDARMRGAAYHRAVARFHKVHNAPTVGTPVQLANELHQAIEEYRRRSFSPITHALWDLERERMRRHASRYDNHWAKFRDKHDHPCPAQMEVDFGPGEPNGELVVHGDHLEIRIRGRIDRIDVVDLDDGGRGFWIIDYKTGKSSNYTGKDIDRFTSLQLPIYAYAASEKVAEFQSLRPLGVAYWFPTSGAKIAKQWSGGNDWPKLRDRIVKVLSEIVSRIRAGEFPLHPNDPDDCTATCDFGQMCRIAQSRGIEKNWMLSLPLVEDADESE